MSAAEYIAACLRAAGTNWTVTNALGSALLTVSEGAQVARPHRLLSLVSAGVVTSGDVRFGVPALARAMYAAAAEVAAGMSTTASLPPAIVPVATVEHDNSQLRYGKGTCASAAACVGAALDGAPGPLDCYVLPCGEPTISRYCLLCMRCDASALAVVYDEMAKLEPSGIQAARIVPPVMNPVNCPNGYKEECCGVRPNSYIFTPVHFVGCNFPLRVVQCEGGGLAVDQDAAVWQPDRSFLRLGPAGLHTKGSLSGAKQVGGAFPSQQKPPSQFQGVRPPRSSKRPRRTSR